MAASHDRVIKPIRVYKSPAEVPTLPLSEPAEAALEQTADTYRDRLITLSRAMAANQHLNNVSKDHVDLAALDLGRSSTRTTKFTGVVGGLLAGASVSSLVSLLVNSDGISYFYGIANLILLVVGLTLVSLELRRTLGDSLERIRWPMTSSEKSEPRQWPIGSLAEVKRGEFRRRRRRTAADLFKGLGRWEGESSEEVMELLRKARRKGDSGEPPVF